MSYTPGDIYYKELVTFNASGISTNLDALPTATLHYNGRDDFSIGAKVYCSNVDIGRYDVSGIIPSTYLLGGSISVAVSGYIAGGLTKAIIDLGVLDNKLYNATVSTSGLNVFSITDLSQLRYKIGIDGTSSTPVNQFNSKLELSISGVKAINVENGINMNQWMSLVGAFAAGSSTVNGNNITYYALNNNVTQRIQSTAISGARNAIVLFLP